MESRQEQNSRLRDIRDAERQSHEQIYTATKLFEKGSWLEKPVKTVMDLLPLFDQYQTIDVLDLGCGVGRNAIPIAQYFRNRQCHIDCIDLLPVAIHKLNENAKHYAVTSSIRGVASSIEAFSIKEASYDLIIAVSALEHIENELLFVDKLREIQSGLRENGIACFIINSEVCEHDPDTNKQLDPQFEVNLPTQRLLDILGMTFSGETVVKKVRPQQYDIPRGRKIVKLSTNVVTFVTRKNF